jgi:NAD(P)-dependent dehydrogenase (short-subunit alcohol dehydrogenase family)
MREKTALVTGGSKGIGYETARGLAAQGATVIIVGRDETRGAASVASLQQKTENSAIIFFQADLSSQSEIRRLVASITDNYRQLHILVNNAGGSNGERQVTADGLEATFATNHLAPFLLTNLLLPLLQTSAPARIVNVNSRQHRSAHIHFDDLQAEKTYDWMDVYSQAKLANLFFTYELARRLQGTNITVNVADPLGTIEAARTVSSQLNTAERLLLPLFAPLMTATRAAQSSIYLASSPEATELNGKYVNFRSKVVRSSPASYDEATAKKVWDISAELTHLDQPDNA